MKKKWIVVIVVATLCVAFGMTAVFAESNEDSWIKRVLVEKGVTESNMIEMEVNSELEEKLKNDQFTEEQLAQDTEALIRDIMDTNLLQLSLLLRSNLRFNPYSNWKNQYNFVAELARREDAAECLYAMYIAEPAETKDTIFGYGDVIYCFLVSEDYFDQLTVEQRNYLLSQDGPILK